MDAVGEPGGDARGARDAGARRAHRDGAALRPAARAAPRTAARRARRAGGARSSQAASAWRAATGSGTTRSLPPLPSTRTSPLREIHVADVERHELADAQPGSVEQLGDGVVAQASELRSLSSLACGSLRASLAGEGLPINTWQSSTASGRGSRFGVRGAGMPRVGSAPRTPSRTRKRKKVRNAASFRPRLAAASRLWRSARKRAHVGRVGPGRRGLPERRRELARRRRGRRARCAARARARRAGGGRSARAPAPSSTSPSTCDSDRGAVRLERRERALGEAFVLLALADPARAFERREQAIVHVHRLEVVGPGAAQVARAARRARCARRAAEPRSRAPRTRRSRRPRSRALRSRRSPRRRRSVRPGRGPAARAARGSARGSRGAFRYVLRCTEP